MKKKVVPRWKRRKSVLGKFRDVAKRLLVRNIVWHYFKITTGARCFRCQEAVEKTEDFHIDHRVPLAESDNPYEMYLDITNVAISHALCNIMHGADVSIAKRKKSK